MLSDLELQILTRMHWIRAKVHVHLDKAKSMQWPGVFAAPPQVGQNVYAVDSDRTYLQITSIAHAYGKDPATDLDGPYLEIQLGVPVGMSILEWEKRCT